ncbi:hypothetical protein AAFC00_002820 [Neodothiora populina]|uniref:ATP synthase F(0) complex subunit e, mitochondrial n=1 Tax=Neodothiora populina TaxID=2781224 RepID=A0ABR3P8D5_9PEZI
MTSTGVNVFRWSALALGVAYGFSHQASISAADKLRENAQEYERKQSLISQAKAEFARKNAPKDSSSKSSANTDFSSPSFDLEAWLKSTESA